MQQLYGLPREDLDHVLVGVGARWEHLRGQHLLVTGGTGFVGRWLLATLLHANDVRGLGLQVTVLTRDAPRFVAEQPDLANAHALQLMQGDVRSFNWPTGRALTHVVHAATDVMTPQTPAETFDTCVRGTQQVLAQMQRAGAKRLLLLSSGAVYGSTSPTTERLAEDCSNAPDCLTPASAYGEGKRVSELLCAMAAAQGGPQFSVARCFAFLGPHLPLDRQLAIGNFIGAALQGCKLHIQGDGTPQRSYLYAADLALWLWTLLIQGQNGRAYNVGGDEAVSIEALAHRVVKALGAAVEVRVARQATPGVAPQRYLPVLKRAADELGLRPQIGLDDAIRRTAAWHRARTAVAAP